MKKYGILLYFMAFLSMPLIGMQPSLYMQWQKAIAGQITYLLLLEDLENADLAQLRHAVQQGININALFGPNGISLLHLAVTHKKADLVEKLLSLGADPFLLSRQHESASDILSVQESTCNKSRVDSDPQLQAYNNEKLEAKNRINTIITGFKKQNGSDTLTPSQRETVQDMIKRNKKIFNTKNSDLKKDLQHVNESLSAINKMQALFAQQRIQKKFCENIKYFAGICGALSSVATLFYSLRISDLNFMRKKRLEMIVKKALHLKNSLFSFDFDPYAPKISFCDDINASFIDTIIANDQYRDALKKSVQQFNDVAARVESTVCGPQYLYHPISHFYEKEILLVQEFEDAYTALKHSIDICIADINAEMSTKARFSAISAAGAAGSFFVFRHAHWTKKWGIV